MISEAYIGLGANVGDPVGQLRQAVMALDDLPNTDVEAVSHVFETEPWGVSDQPPFANAVVRARTMLRADQLLDALQELETTLGRVRAARYGPRAIDLDIVLFGDEEWDTETLVIPHPRAAERDFVLTPLLAIAPGVTWPDGSPVRKHGELVGRVVADHGRIPETDPDWYTWEALGTLLADAAPRGQEPPWGQDDVWAEVAVGSARGAEIDIIESKLRAAGIPYELSHREFGDAIGLFGGPSKVLVPAGRADEARSVLGTAPGSPSQALPVERGTPYIRPAWFRATLRVFGWLFAVYWIVRILARGGFGW